YLDQRIGLSLQPSLDPDDGGARVEKKRLAPAVIILESAVVIDEPDPLFSILLAQLGKRAPPPGHPDGVHLIRQPAGCPDRLSRRIMRGRHEHLITCRKSEISLPLY